MNPQPSGAVSVAQPGTYRIRVRGHIGQSWSDRFDGMAISTSAPTEGPVVTTLLGDLPDQAALMGVINFLYDLRLPVLSVEWLYSLDQELQGD
jgi:hypothetical protein